MIVNYTDKGWQIITQRSHGLLAAQICAFWNKNNQPERWIETLVATAEHDDANNELEKTDLLEKTGGPKNFKMNPFEAAYCDNLLNKAITKGRYVALLVSRHIQFLYGEMEEGKSYCQALQKLEKLWIKEAGTTKSAIDQSYELLEFCDAFSLLICQELVQPENRKIEISNGPDDVSYDLKMGEDKQLIVNPWPFEPDTFSVSYESRILSQLTFKNVEDFVKSFLASPVKRHEILIAKS